MSSHDHGDNNRFPDIGDMLSYFPENMQVLRLPNFNITDHLRNLLGGSGKSSGKSRKIKTKDTPFVPQPPVEGCLINNLPPEILSWIFVLGDEMSKEQDEFDDGDDDSDEEDEPQDGPEGHTEEKDPDAMEGIIDEHVLEETGEDGSDWEDEPEDPDTEEESDSDDSDSDSFSEPVPFQILVSHVCQYWRQVAISTPSLWNCLDFAEEAPFFKSSTYLERSKGYPLVIEIDLSDRGGLHDDCSSVASGHDCHGMIDLNLMLILLIPHIYRWAVFHLTADHYAYMHTALTKLSTAPAAPLLESLQFYHHEDELAGSAETFAPAEYKTPLVLFSNNLPKLQRVALWGVHVDWTNTTFLKNLTHLELAYHSLDVRPSYEEFFSIFRASPALESLALCLSGPREEPHEWSTIVPAAPTDPEAEHSYAPAASYVQLDEFLTMGSLHDVTLEFHPPECIMAILDRLYLPNLQNLSLDFEDQDYTEFMSYLSSPAKHGGDKEPIVAGLRSLKLVQLPCTSKPVVQTFLSALKKLEALRVNFHHLDLCFLELLTESAAVPPETAPPLPLLTSLMITGLDGPHVKALVKGRNDAGVPLQTLFVDGESEIEEEDEEWLRGQVDEFRYFVDSDDEDALDIDDDEEEEEDWL